LNAATNSRMTTNIAYTLPGAVPGWQPPTWRMDSATTPGGGNQGNVFANNKNGVPPTAQGAYPPCPI
jgi:hypothetical protein